MKNKSIISKVISGVMMASMVVPSSGAFAAETGSNTNDTTIVATTTQAYVSNNSTTPNAVVPGVPGGIPGGAPGGAPGGGEDTSVTSGPAAYLQSGQTISLSNQQIKATETNESIVKVSDSGNLTLTNSKLTKTGDTSADGSSNFYGLNAGVLSESGSKITISNCEINTSANGSNAIFATGAGSVVNVNNVTIKTTKDSSRGLDATLTGTVNAKNVNITTAGAHCAGLATDRGCGTINVTNGAITTAGEGSPGIYSTGTIIVADSSFKATGSEAAVIEGKNSISLTNSSLSGAKKHGVMLYQSFSGDAEVGTSSFKMTGGSLKAAVGPLFYATNTDAVIELKGADIKAESGTLLTASADSWGTNGENGAIVSFTADSEQLNGNITCDSISTITATLKNNTALKGSINTDNTAKSVDLSLDSTSTWNVTGTSYITSLTDADATLANIKDNGNSIYYDSSVSANSWLDGKTYTLTNGGTLAPLTK